MKLPLKFSLYPPCHSHKIRKPKKRKKETVAKYTLTRKTNKLVDLEIKGVTFNRPRGSPSRISVPALYKINSGSNEPAAT